MSETGVALARLGVIGGTFDPIHVGHLVAASEVLYSLSLDRVLFVPTGMPWQKSRRSDPEDRFMMTSLAVAAHPRFAVSRIELDRRGPTYTVDTMAELRSFHGLKTEMFFIVGADAVLGLGTWHEVERLKELCEIVAVSRPGISLEGFIPLGTWPVVKTVDVPGIDISSTDIRERVAADRPIDFLVPAEVVRYIAERGLYREEADV